MDYLNVKKEHRHSIVLLTGYLLIAIGIAIASLVLLYQAYGFGIGKHGAVIQNGLTFFSSQPSGANIYIDGKLNSAKTSARLPLPEGIYHVKITRDGYRDWQRTVELDGGSVEHFDYPLLIPAKLTTTKLATYTTAPKLSTQSPDRRWLMVSQDNSMTNFDVYDLKNPDKAPTVITLPDTVLTKATGPESWQLGEWADDNQHVLLQHIYDGKTEYVMVDRSAADQSVNLTTTLSADQAQISLKNKKYDQYYLFRQATGDLRAATLKQPTPEATLDHVVAFKAYGDDTLLYATNDKAPQGKVLIKLKVGDTTYPIRSFDAGSTDYPLDLAEYSGTLYIVAGATNDSRVYIYKDPIGQLHDAPTQAVSPIQVLHVDQPNYVSFSTNAQFIMAENGQKIGVYDIENKAGHSYTQRSPLDAPQAHATWMDGDRLTYTSGGKQLIFDYDNMNQQFLTTTSPSYLPAFAPNYRRVFTFAPSAASADQTELTETNLLTPADQ